MRNINKKPKKLKAKLTKSSQAIKSRIRETINISEHINRYERETDFDTRCQIMGDVIIDMLNLIAIKSHLEPNIILQCILEMDTIWQEFTNKITDIGDDSEYHYSAHKFGFRQALSSSTSENNESMRSLFDKIGWDYDKCYHLKDTDSEVVVHLEFNK